MSMEFAVHTDAKDCVPKIDQEQNKSTKVAVESTVLQSTSDVNPSAVLDANSLALFDITPFVSDADTLPTIAKKVSGAFYPLHKWVCRSCMTTFTSATPIPEDHVCDSCDKNDVCMICAERSPDSDLIQVGEEGIYYSTDMCRPCAKRIKKSLAEFTDI